MKLISTMIDIAAPAEKIWKILADFSAYPEWNPFITSLSGPLAVGETLTARIQPPGGRAMEFKPRVLVADPSRQLRWKGKLILPGLFDGEHFFELEPMAGGTRFHHGEKFSGVLTAMMGKSSFAAIREGFEAMNGALKARAEA